MKTGTFIQGEISSQLIADSIAKHQSKTTIGAHNIFLGQIREDKIGGKSVSSIEFSYYQEMATIKIKEIREDAFKKFELVCMHIHHSLGLVNIGQICFFVFVSTEHRDDVYEATEYIVNRVKSEVPIFGKEYFKEGSYQWKSNIVL